MHLWNCLAGRSDCFQLAREMRLGKATQNVFLLEEGKVILSVSEVYSPIFVVNEINTSSRR